MGEVSEKTIHDYRAAREAEDYATQAGILSALLHSILYQADANATIARETAEAILEVRTKTK